MIKHLHFMVYLNLTIYLFKVTSDEMQLIYYVGLE